MSLDDHDPAPTSRRHALQWVGAGFAAAPALLAGTTAAAESPTAASASASASAAARKTLQDPRDEYPKPPFPPQQQPRPGLAARMQPRPDHGETSYVGSGRLSGRKALITGGDSCIGRDAAIAYAREGADVAFGYLPAEEEDEARVDVGPRREEPGERPDERNRDRRAAPPDTRRHGR